MKQGLKFVLSEVGIIITDEDVRDSEMGEDDLFKKPSDHLGVISRASKGFHPFGYIIHGEQDKFVTSGGWESSHEITPQTSKISTSRM